MSELAVSSPKRLGVFVEGGLVLLVQLKSSKAGILIKIRNAVHLVALALSDVVENCLRLLQMHALRGIRDIRSEDVKIDARRVKHVNSRLELLRVVKTINLSRLGISPVSTLLNLRRQASSSLGRSSLNRPSSKDLGVTLAIQTSAVEALSSSINILGCLEEVICSDGLSLHTTFLGS